jgi:hypothetical protein
MSMHIKAEVCVTCVDNDGGIVIPADDAWLDAMRNSVRHAGLVVFRLDNFPVDGSTGKVALTIGATTTALDVPGDEDDYLEFGSDAEAPMLFGFLLDSRKLAELIAALQLMQAHFPTNEGVARG